MTAIARTCIALLLGAALAVLPGCRDDDSAGTGNGPASSSGAVTEADLAEVDQMLVELGTELKSLDGELRTADEGDLTR